MDHVKILVYVISLKMFSANITDDYLLTPLMSTMKYSPTFWGKFNGTMPFLDIFFLLNNSQVTNELLEKFKNTQLLSPHSLRLTVFS